jgi:outer membrane protein assembly factor BamB
MSWSSRRAALVLTAAAFFAGVSVVGHVYAQRRARPPIAVPGGPAVPGAPATPGAPGARPSYDLGSLTLPKDGDDLKEPIDAAVDHMKRKDWAAACKNLQDLVGRPTDVWVPLTRTDPAGREVPMYGSVKLEAARLLGSLPPAGRAFYEATYGPKADALVRQARTNNDPVQMGQAMSLYFFTDAGAEAAAWLGTYHLDRAEFHAAASFYLKLIHRDGVKALKDRTLLKAAYAFHNLGSDADALRAKETAFRELDRRDAHIKLRDEVRSAADLKEAVNRVAVRASQQSASDSPIYRGRPNRNAVLPGGTPFLEAAWKFPMARHQSTKQKLQAAVTFLESRTLPVLSSFFPVTATVTKNDRPTPLLIYRDYSGVHAANMKTGKLEWDSLSEWGLDRVFDTESKDRNGFVEARNAYTQWLGYWQTVRPQIVMENSALGALSADTKMVYAIEDLAAPAPAHMISQVDPWGRATGQNWGSKVSAAINHNKLQALSLAKEGSLAWEVGGPEGTGPLQGAFFVGPPLPLNGKLYVLTEKQQELRLVTLDPADKGKVLAVQTLANTKDVKLSNDPYRRVQAAHLAYAEGILVVPTNAGAVFAVDLLSNSLVWAYPYRESTPSKTAPAAGMPGMIIRPGWPVQPVAPTEVHWQVTAPVIQDGKVVFAAPDGRGIHCVSLRDGTRLWSHARQTDDLYLAGVFHGKVVVVGKHRTRAMTLSRGDLAWELETGVPSGQGAAGAPTAGGDILYYLPVGQAVNTREPEICAINVDKGLIHAHTRSRQKEVPGNLLFYEGNMLSQTHAQVTAYPQLEIKLAEMDRKVKANPQDTLALTERGDYLLDKGDLGGAIADFRKALRHDPPPATRGKARTKLYEAFTEFFQRNFNKAEDYLSEYEEMCKVELGATAGAERSALMAEQRRRRANFLCLVGKGREAQNRLAEAFEKYLELGEEGRKDELIQVVDEPSVKSAPDVWSQGRIAAMVQNASDPKQKQSLENLITARWQKLRATQSPPLEGLRRFVALFGSLFGVGKEARLALAERLMEDTDVNSLLEAEQQLSLLRGPQEPPAVAARAIEALARLNTRKGLLEDAAFYYRLLGERYPKVVVDGKRGEEYLEDLATDKRFLPYLEQPGRFVLRGKMSMKGDGIPGGTTGTQPYQFGHVGEPLPFFTRNRLSVSLDYGSRLLKLTDAATGEERWKSGLEIAPTHFQQIAQNTPQAHRVRHVYQTLGHLVVVQVGHMVYGIDPRDKGRVLWGSNLSTLPASAGNPPPYVGQPVVDARDDTVVLAYTDGWTQRLGGTGPLQGGVICLQMREELRAVDPVSGRTLWTRSDVHSGSHVFGDEQHIYVVGMAPGSERATGSRVFRAYDGVSVKAPDFSAAYEQRLRMVGRNILAVETDVRTNTPTLRLYDVLAGKDLWRQKFSPGAFVLKSEDPNLAGVVERGGVVRVLDVRTQKEVLNARLDTKPGANDGANFVKDGATVSLVSDPDFLYVAINNPVDAKLAPWGVNPNLTAGLRSLPVNGRLYAFRRGAATRFWYTEAVNQFLLLTQFEELPVVVLTSRYQKGANNPFMRQIQQVVEAFVLVKHNGKVCYDNVPNVPPGTIFGALSMDQRTGKVELSGQQFKVVMTPTLGGTVKK